MLNTLVTFLTSIIDWFKTRSAQNKNHKQALEIQEKNHNHEKDENKKKQEHENSIQKSIASENEKNRKHEKEIQKSNEIFKIKERLINSVENPIELTFDQINTMNTIAHQLAIDVQQHHSLTNDTTAIVAEIFKALNPHKAKINQLLTKLLNEIIRKYSKTTIDLPLPNPNPNTPIDTNFSTADYLGLVKFLNHHADEDIDSITTLFSYIIHITSEPTKEYYPNFRKVLHLKAMVILQFPQLDSNGNPRYPELFATEALSLNSTKITISYRENPSPAVSYYLHDTSKTRSRVRYYLNDTGKILYSLLEPNLPPTPEEAIKEIIQRYHPSVINPNSPSLIPTH